MKKILPAALLAIILFTLGFLTKSYMPNNNSSKITTTMITKAQKDWGDGLVKIGQKSLQTTDQSELEKVASEVVSKLYAYDYTDVAFKPTKAQYTEFRSKKNEAISYFVKGIYSEDTGFGLNPWKAVRFSDNNVIIKDNTATIMGNYYFKDYSDKETKVDYTFEYELHNGEVKIILQHSSLPYEHKE